jgi:hypothetical protein
MNSRTDDSRARLSRKATAGPAQYNKLAGDDDIVALARTHVTREQAKTFTPLSERTRPNSFPEPIGNEPKLTVVAAKDELVRLLGNLIVHRLGKFIRIHFAKRLERLVVFRGNEKTPRRDRQDDVRIGLTKSI